METVQHPQAEAPVAEQALPMSGAELMARMEDRLPPEQHARLHAVAAKYDGVMQSLTNPGEKEQETTLEGLTGYYSSQRAQAFKSWGLGMGQKHEAADSSRTIEAHFPSRIDHTPVTAAFMSKLDVRPATMHMAGRTFQMAASSEQMMKSRVDELSRGLIAANRERVVNTVLARVEEMRSRGQEAPIDGSVIRTSLATANERQIAQIGESTMQILDEFDKAFPPKSRDGKISRFLTRQAGVRGGTQDSQAGRFVDQLDRRLNTSLQERNLEARKLISETVSSEITGLRGRAMDYLQQQSGEFLASLKDAANDQRIIEWAMQALRSQGYNVALKGEARATGSSRGHHEKRETHHASERKTSFDARVQQTVDQAVNRMRAEGISESKIRIRLMQQYHPDVSPDTKEAFQYVESLGLGKK